MANTVKDVWEMECPECHSDEYLKITATTTLSLTADGTEDDSCHEWGDNSDCECSACGWIGIVASARIEEEDELQPAATNL